MDHGLAAIGEDGLADTIAIGPMSSIGEEMYGWATDLFPICRSLTGEGNRQTLRFLSKILPQLSIHEVPTGTQAFDWTVPKEWNVRQAYVVDPHGNRIIDFKQNNLHLVSYSVPVDTAVSFEELQQHLYSLPEMPDAIPYVTSYYAPRWGFCLTHKDRLKLVPGEYRVRVESTLNDGCLTYGELILPGTEEKEVLVSTYICHPSLANNELSGPVVTTALARAIQAQTPRRFTYRFVFVPETLGTIVYLSRNFDAMRRNTIAGFVVTCVGDDRAYSFMPSRRGNTLADKVAKITLRDNAPNYVSYSFRERGSDERQYCSPGVDLPVVSVMRSKYGAFPEYHTSKDNMDLITPRGLQGSLDILISCIEVLEHNRSYVSKFPCEPQLGKRGLYPTLSRFGSADASRAILDLLAYTDGDHDLLDIAEKTGLPVHECIILAEMLSEHGLLFDAQGDLASCGMQVPSSK